MKKQQFSGRQTIYEMASSVVPSSRKGIPTVFPKGASRLYAGALIAHMRSRKVPRHTSVVPERAAMLAPKNKKIPTAVIPLCDFD